MSKTVSFMGVLALAATTTLAQSSTTTSGQASGTGTTSGTMSGQSSTTKDKTKSGHGTMATGAGSLAAADHRFVMEAAHGGMAEVELGRLATQKASNADVKSFGQMMVDDHSKANDELKSLASSKGITVPSDLEAKDKATMSRLEKLSGEQFDRAYMQTMVKDHKKDVAAFKHASTAAKDPELKSFAEKTLPTLEKHLQKAEQTASAVGASTAGKSGATGSTTGTAGSKAHKKGTNTPGSK